MISISSMGFDNSAFTFVVAGSQPWRQKFLAKGCCNKELRVQFSVALLSLSPKAFWETTEVPCNMLPHHTCQYCIVCPLIIQHLFCGFLSMFTGALRAFYISCPSLHWCMLNQWVCLLISLHCIPNLPTYLMYVFTEQLKRLLLGSNQQKKKVVQDTGCFHKEMTNAVTYLPMYICRRKVSKAFPHTSILIFFIETYLNIICEE